MVYSLTESIDTKQIISINMCESKSLVYTYLNQVNQVNQA